MHDFVGQNGEFLAIGDPALLPLIGQVLTHRNAAQALADPLLGVALFLVKLLHPAHGQLGVFNLVQAFFAYLGQPAFEGLGLRAGNGLDQAENALRIPALDFLASTRRVERQCKGGSICPPHGCPGSIWQRIAKTPIARGRDASTFKKHMLACAPAGQSLAIKAGWQPPGL